MEQAEAVERPKDKDCFADSPLVGGIHAYGFLVVRARLESCGAATEFPPEKASLHDRPDRLTQLARQPGPCEVPVTL